MLETVGTLGYASDEFKQKIDAITEFIESCWDENNPDDGLTFDERLNQRIVELPAEIRNIIVAASGKFEENPDIQEPKDGLKTDPEIEEEIERDECECCEAMDIHALLKLAYEASYNYELKKKTLKIAQSKLRLETKWEEVFETKPTEKDKEAFIIMKTEKTILDLVDVENEANYLKELYNLEKLFLRESQ